MHHRRYPASARSRRVPASTADTSAASVPPFAASADAIDLQRLRIEARDDFHDHPTVPSRSGAEASRRSASWTASCSCSRAFVLRSSFPSCCSFSTAAGSSSGSTESTRTEPATASRSSRTTRSARPPQTNVTREPPLNFSARGHGDQADGAGARHVRAAACREVEVRALRSGAARPPAPAPCAAAAPPLPSADAKRIDTATILPDDPVGLVHGALDRRPATPRARDRSSTTSAPR